MRIPHLSLAALLFVAACGSSDDTETEVVDRLEAELTQQQPLGGTCALAQCNGLVNPHGVLVCTSWGACYCKASSGKTGRCDSQGQNCKESCIASTDGSVIKP